MWLFSKCRIWFFLQTFSSLLKISEKITVPSDYGSLLCLLWLNSKFWVCGSNLSKRKTRHWCAINQSSTNQDQLHFFWPIWLLFSLNYQKASPQHLYLCTHPWETVETLRATQVNQLETVLGGRRRFLPPLKNMVIQNCIKLHYFLVESPSLSYRPTPTESKDGFGVTTSLWCWIDFYFDLLHTKTSLGCITMHLFAKN